MPLRVEAATVATWRENGSTLGLLRKLAPAGKQVLEDEVLTIDVPLPADLGGSGGEVPEDHALYRLLIGAAAGVLVVAQTTSRLRDWLLARMSGRSEPGP